MITMLGQKNSKIIYIYNVLLAIVYLFLLHSLTPQGDGKCGSVEYFMRSFRALIVFTFNEMIFRLLIRVLFYEAKLFLN